MWLSPRHLYNIYKTMARETRAEYLSSKTSYESLFLCEEEEKLVFVFSRVVEQLPAYNTCFYKFYLAFFTYIECPKNQLGNPFCHFYSPITFTFQNTPITFTLQCTHKELHKIAKDSQLLFDQLACVG